MRTPGFTDFGQELTDQISSESQGNIRLTNLEKTSSEENEVFGQKTHIIHYKAKIEFLKSCWLYVDETGEETKIENFETYIDQPEFIPSMTYLSMNYKKGDIVDIVGKETFIHTDNGWVRQRKPKIF